MDLAVKISKKGGVVKVDSHTVAYTAHELIIKMNTGSRISLVEGEAKLYCTVTGYEYNVVNGKLQVTVFVEMW